MERLLTATCVKCGNKFHVGGEVDDPPGAAAYRCRCPRCNTDFAVDIAGGVPQPGRIEWAVRAEKCG